MYGKEQELLIRNEESVLWEEIIIFIYNEHRKYPEFPLKKFSKEFTSQNTYLHRACMKKIRKIKMSNFYSIFNIDMNQKSMRPLRNFIQNSSKDISFGEFKCISNNTSYFQPVNGRISNMPEILTKVTIMGFFEFLILIYYNLSIHNI